MPSAINRLHQIVSTLAFGLVLAVASAISALMVYDIWSKRASNIDFMLADSRIDSVASHLLRALLLHWSLVLTVSVVVGAFMVLLLWLECRSLLKRTPRLILSRGGLGEVAISLDQIGLLAQHEAERVDGVREVRTVARSKKAGVQVQQSIAVEPGRQLPDLAEKIQQQVKQSLEYHLGFPVAGVHIALQQTSMSKALL